MPSSMRLWENPESKSVVRRWGPMNTQTFMVLNLLGRMPVNACRDSAKSSASVAGGVSVSFC